MVPHKIVMPPRYKTAGLKPIHPTPSGSWEKVCRGMLEMFVESALADIPKGYRTKKSSIDMKSPYKVEVTFSGKDGDKDVKGTISASHSPVLNYINVKVDYKVGGEKKGGTAKIRADYPFSVLLSKIKKVAKP